MKAWLAGTLLILTLGVGAFALAQMNGSDEEIAAEVWEMIGDQAYAFTWHYETEPPPGFYRGNEPHGLVLRTFMNNIAFDAVQNTSGTFPPNSVIVKENHVTEMDADANATDDSADRSVPNFEPNLESTTVMVKIAGYNPEAGDWFWAKYQPDGSLDAVGKPAGCIGCHGQVADNDWVFDAKVTGE